MIVTVDSKYIFVRIEVVDDLDFAIVKLAMLMANRQENINQLRLFKEQP
jgi:hypothetical protein